MTTVVLDSPDYHVHINNQVLHIQHNSAPPRLLPLNAIERVVLGTGITLSTDLQLALAGAGKELVVIGRKHCVSLFNPHAAPNNVRIRQYQAVCEPAKRAKLVRALLDARRAGQNRVLAKLGCVQLPALTHTQGHPMLQEAQLSHQYWRQWAVAFYHDGFKGRERQPPNDPINALLSLTATLEDQALAPALLAEGFDLAIGLHHATGYRRASLVLDVKELTRAELELWVLTQWQAGTFTHAHFSSTAAGCRLTREGQQQFYLKWFAWQKKRRPALRRLARLCRYSIERA